MYICNGNITIIGVDYGMSPGLGQAIHDLNQCWNIVIWTAMNKLKWNFSQNSYILIQENAFGMLSGLETGGHFASAPVC